MKPEDFEFIRTLVKERSGLVLTEDKTYLLESRLMPVARKRGMKGLDELCADIRANKDADVIREVTEAMTTNESFFFRDIKPFELFREIVLPRLLELRTARKNFRIWCAAAASGQEPYTLAMILKEEAAKLAGWTYEIIATDISTEILSKAEKGIYTQFEVQRGLPVQLLVKYFKQNGDKWHIDPDLKRVVKYKEFNLLDNLTSLGRFDVVFCRNVLIYFDQETKAQVLERVSGLMPKDGVLFLGGAETVVGITDKFKPMPGRRGVYCPVAATPEAAPAIEPALRAAVGANTV